jgi:hypothetical protein
MWIELIIIIGILCAGYYFLKTARSGNPRHAGVMTFADIPAKVPNPSRYAGIKSVVAWEFMAPNLSTACSFARKHDRIRMSAADCTPPCHWPIVVQKPVSAITTRSSMADKNNAARTGTAGPHTACKRTSMRLITGV